MSIPCRRFVANELSAWQYNECSRPLSFTTWVGKLKGVLRPHARNGDYPSNGLFRKKLPRRRPLGTQADYISRIGRYTC